MAERVTAVAGVKHPEGFNSGTAGTPNSVTKERYPGYRKGHIIIRRGFEQLANALSHVHLSEGSVENLEEAKRLHSEGVRGSGLGSHESDLDGLAINIALRKGDASVLAEEMVIGMGDKILGKGFRGIGAHSYPHIPLPQVDGPVSAHDSRLYKKMLFDARRAIPNLMEDGKFFFTFIGGTRSKDGVLTEGRAQLAHYFTNPDNTFVLPIAVNGTREAWPVEGRPRLFRDIYVCFGAPIMIGDIMRQIDNYERENQRAIDKSERYRIIVDTILRQGIAPMIKPEKRGMYGDLQITPVEWVLAHPQPKATKEAA
jgi:1-acyl-sn-glycerol-3-phosphate acyltransferase